MIRNNKEYERALEQIEQERTRLQEHRARLVSEGLDAEGITRVLDPMQCLHLQLQEEVDSYERLQQGHLGEITNLRGLGRILVGLRIARGITQKDLAERLGVHLSQVSRDERNEYHGVTVDRAARTLEALEASLESSFPNPILPFPGQGSAKSQAS